MKLEFHGHDERYIVEQSLMNLFPLEKPVYGTVKPGEDDWCRLTAAETAVTCHVSAALRYQTLNGKASGGTPWPPAFILPFWSCTPSSPRQTAPPES